MRGKRWAVLLPVFYLLASSSPSAYAQGEDLTLLSSVQLDRLLLTSSQTLADSLAKRPDEIAKLQAENRKLSEDLGALQIKADQSESDWKASQAEREAMRKQLALFSELQRKERAEMDRKIQSQAREIILLGWGCAVLGGALGIETIILLLK